ncbi:MAG: glycosyltransferase family 92 protein [Cyanobacteria bacterium RM1_2_2]|nr:glycosyltransferase family 92 protein [Cyanobacteria bacterium RM1_2_2]
MKYEAPYLLEWLEFHKLVGVQRFYLYENGDGHDIAEIVQPYLESGEVILHDWPVAPGQLPAYKHCLQTYSQDSEWIAFIDLDEFLFPTVESDLKDTLDEFASTPGVGVNWLMFGTSGHGVRPAGLQIENFTKRAETDFAENRHIKSIVRPDRVLPPADPHFFSCKDGVTVTENHLPLSSALTDSVSVGKLRINHYFTRSREDMHQKMLRGRADNGTSRNWEFMEYTDRNEVEDLTIQRFLPQLKQAIEAYPGVMDKSFTVVPEVEVICDSSLLWTGYLDYPQVNRPVYGSMLFVSGWVIAKRNPVIAIRAALQNRVVAEIPVNLSRPDVLKTYQFITNSPVLGFRGTLNLNQLPDQSIVHLEAVFADQSCAFYGYFKASKTTKSLAYLGSSLL